MPFVPLPTLPATLCHSNIAPPNLSTLFLPFGPWHLGGNLGFFPLRTCQPTGENWQLNQRIYGPNYLF